MFRVVEKSKGKKAKTGKILNIIIIALVIILLLFFVTTIIFWSVDFKKNIVYECIGGLLLFFIPFKIIHHNFFQQKKAVFIGNLIFKEDEIEILNKIYPLENISKIRIKGNDIKGDFRGLKSEGVNNELFIDLINGEEINYFFEQTLNNTIKDLLVLKNYVAKGKLAQSNYDSILDNTNYY